MSHRNTPRERLVELVEPSEEIRRHCQDIAESAPDVESGDESVEDVFQYYMELFRQHGRDVLAKDSR